MYLQCFVDSGVPFKPPTQFDNMVLAWIMETAVYLYEGYLWTLTFAGESSGILAWVWDWEDI